MLIELLNQVIGLGNFPANKDEKMKKVQSLSLYKKDMSCITEVTYLICESAAKRDAYCLVSPFRLNPVPFVVIQLGLVFIVSNCKSNYSYLRRLSFTFQGFS